MRAGVLVLLGLALCLVGASPADAQRALTRIRAEKVLHCGAVERPGIAERPPTGGAVGVAVDLCRALAVAVLGPGGKVSFSLLEAPASFDRLRTGADEVAFLTGSEISEAGIGDAVLPGPVVAVSRIGVMVPEAAPVQHLSDLSGHTVCMMTGSAGQRAIEQAAASLHLSIARLMFQEDVEMLDAYNAGRCSAVAAEDTYLAGMRLTPGVRHGGSRLLPESLAASPIVAVTNAADGPWGARVAWVVNALLLAGRPENAWRAGGAEASPVRQLPGLRPHWQQEVVAAVGSYADILQRNLTDRLGLPVGLNAAWPGGVLLPLEIAP